MCLANRCPSHVAFAKRGVCQPLCQAGLTAFDTPLCCLFHLCYFGLWILPGCLCCAPRQYNAVRDSRYCDRCHNICSLIQAVTAVTAVTAGRRPRHRVSAPAPCFFRVIPVEISDLPSGNQTKNVTCVCVSFPRISAAVCMPFRCCSAPRRAPRRAPRGAPRRAPRRLTLFRRLIAMTPERSRDDHKDHKNHDSALFVSSSPGFRLHPGPASLRRRRAPCRPARFKRAFCRAR